MRHGEWGIVTTPDSASFEHAFEPAFEPPDIAGDDEFGALAACIGRIAQRDDDALTILYGLMALPLCAAAKRLLGSNECAQEVVCDVFVHVWQHAADYDEKRGSVKAWLYGITRNRAIDRWRRDRRHPLLTMRLLREQQAELTGPDQILGTLQDSTFVHAALSALSPLRQQLLNLAFFDGLSHEEISRASGMPLGTVKSHLRRALQAMRTALPPKRRSTRL